MLQSKIDAPGSSFPIASSREAMDALVGIVRRQLPVFIITIGCIGLLALAYLLTTPSKYAASGLMLIDTRKVQLVQQQQQVVGDAPMDASSVQTQIEVLKSENISLAVIKKLKLDEDPEFIGTGGGLLTGVRGLFSQFLPPPEEPSQYRLQRNALRYFEQNRLIARVGLTYVMELRFTSTDPEKSARIANAIADAYSVDQLEAKFQATRNASVWLQERIQTLRSQVATAEKAVVDFKAQNNLVSSNGRLVNDQQLSEINTQLVTAQAASAEAKARFDRIQEVLANPLAEGIVNDAQRNEVIVKLRQQFNELQSRESIWAQRYGRDHLAAINLRNQMQEIRRNISEEYQKIAQGYRSDYEIAASREAALRASLATVIGETQSTSQSQIQLRELESNAQTYRTLYDNFLQRYMESVQQQSFPITEARLISPAAVPLVKSEPRTLIVLVIAGAFGVIASFGIAFLREFSDSAFRTTAQVEETLKATCLGILPALSLKAAKRSGPAPKPDQRLISVADSINSYVVDAPFSPFTETLRSLKVNVDLAPHRQSNSVLGFTSTLPGEGKSTISSNFAELVAHGGARCILIDADLRNPTLTRSLGPHAKKGLVELVAGTAKLEEVLLRDDRTGLFFLPTGDTRRIVHTAEFLGSEGMHAVVQDLRQMYDYVIMDLSPIAPVVDARMTTRFMDSYIFIVEWGKTKADVLEHAIANAPEVYDKILGVVLNKADMRKLGRYERGRSDYYMQKYYGRYGYLTNDRA